MVSEPETRGRRLGSDASEAWGSHFAVGAVDLEPARASRNSKTKDDDDNKTMCSVTAPHHHGEGGGERGREREASLCLSPPRSRTIS